MERSLRRRAGVEISSCAWMAIPWAGWRADPNGYYTRLGLDPATPVLMSQIDAAWRRRLRELHPDTGSGDVAALARARVAYEVLSDPDTRQQYDALGPNEVWMDELLLEEIVRVVTAGPEPEATSSRLSAQGQAKVSTTEGSASVDPTPHLVPVPPVSPQVYYWDDDESALPDDEVVRAWASEIGRAMWEMFSESDAVKVGFTTGAPTIEVRSWGVIHMVPAGVEPSEGIARAAVLAAKKETRMPLRREGFGPTVSTPDKSGESRQQGKEQSNG